MLQLFILLCYITSSFTTIINPNPTLDFYTSGEPFTNHQDVSDTYITLQVDNLPNSFDLEKLNESISQILDPLKNPQIAQQTKTLLTNVKEKYIYFIELLTARISFFSGPPFLNNRPCSIKMDSIYEKTPDNTKQIFYLLQKLTPATPNTETLNDVTSTQSQQIIGTLIYLLPILTSLITFLEHEKDLFQQVSQNILPPFFQSTISESNCLSQNKYNRFQILQTQFSTDKIVITIKTTQSTPTTLIKLVPTPFYNFSLNLSNSNNNTFLNSKLEIITLTCETENNNCIEKPVDMSCLHALTNKNFPSAIEKCKFYESSNKPILVEQGILIPAGSYITLSPTNTVPNIPSTVKSLPFILQTATSTQVTFNNKIYTFGPTSKTGTKYIPFYLTQTEAANLYNLLTDPKQTEFPLRDIIIFSTFSTIIFFLVTFLAYNSKFNPYAHLGQPSNKSKQKTTPIVLRLSTTT